MKSSERNAGTRRTTQALKMALVDLLVEKDLREITITEIVERAAYARGTFYAHYRYKEDLLDELVAEMVSGFVAAFQAPYESRRERYNIIELNDSTVFIFQYIAEHAQCFGLLFTRTNTGFQEKLRSALRDLMDKEYDFLFSVIPSHINRELFINQSVYMLLGLIAYWIESGYKYSAAYMTDQLLAIAKLTHQRATEAGSVL